MRWDRDNYRPYVRIADRRTQAERLVAKMRSQGKNINPVMIDGGEIVHTFWGEAWCENLENYSDYASRLPKGRSIVRNNAVLDLKIQPGHIQGLVIGSDLYEIAIHISPLLASLWGQLKTRCAGQIGTLVELLQGKLSQQVMALVTEPETGLFPKPDEISFSCTCPDYADLCKHIVAVLYGVGARLDQQPELLFHLRQVDYNELISSAVQASASANQEKSSRKRLAQDDLAHLFGFQIEQNGTNHGTMIEMPDLNLLPLASSLDIPNNADESKMPDQLIESKLPAATTVTASDVKTNGQNEANAHGQALPQVLSHLTTPSATPSKAIAARDQILNDEDEYDEFGIFDEEQLPNIEFKLSRTTAAESDIVVTHQQAQLPSFSSDPSNSDSTASVLNTNKAAPADAAGRDSNFTFATTEFPDRHHDPQEYLLDELNRWILAFTDLQQQLLDQQQSETSD